jgi:DNA polymerase-3 subunit gamma/tau
MYQVIARKYRPAQFSELISQEHVRTTLANAITQHRIAHGYILSGQRGTGKTTVARIIARCLNCINGPTAQPCGECASCREIAAGSSMDVIEIDAASNRGINEMRELRENVRFRPARDRHKVFIIDEAHQITPEAFNALLKTLEEPPEWVVFILCTTESHKIPVTIASRCQQFSFRSVDFAELIDRMRWICAQEGIQADDEVLGLIAQAGEGSVRDSLSALDQAIACCGTTLSADEVRQLLGMFSIESLREVTTALEAADPARMLEVVGELERNGRSLHHFCRELARYFRNLLVAKIAGRETRLIGASAPEQARLLEISSRFSEEDLTRYLQLTLDLYKEMQTSLQPRLHLEVGLLRLVHAGRLRPIEEALSALKSGAPQQPSRTPQPAAPPPPPSPPARTGPSPFERDVARRPATSPLATVPKPDLPPWSADEAKPAPVPKPVLVPKAEPARTAPVPEDGDLRTRLIATLQEMDRPFVVDNIELASVAEAGSELVITAPKEACTALRFSEGDLQQACQRLFGKAMRVRLQEGAAANAPAVPAATRRSAGEEELMERALADPGVQSFREAFPGAEVRQVRNLKD